MRKVLAGTVLGLAAVLATACAGDTRSFSDRLAGPSRVRGDADGVTVFQAASRTEAFPLAIGHCARFSKSAQYDAPGEEGGLHFRCVPG